jgi:hypothetical protein
LTLNFYIELTSPGTGSWKHGFVEVEVFNPVLAQGSVELGPIADDSQGVRYAEWDMD